MRGLGSPSPSYPLPRPRDFSLTRCVDMKTLIILLCCLTPSVVPVADEYLEADLAVVSTPTGDQLEPRDDARVTLATEVDVARAPAPEVVRAAWMHALSVRRITDPFGARTLAALQSASAYRTTNAAAPDVNEGP